MAAVKVNEDIKEEENDASTSSVERAGIKQEHCDVVINADEQFASLIHKSTIVLPYPFKKVNLPPDYRIWYFCSPENDLNAEIKDGNIVPVDTYPRVTEELLKRTASVTGLNGRQITFEHLCEVIKETEPAVVHITLRCKKDRSPRASPPKHFNLVFATAADCQQFLDAEEIKPKFEAILFKKAEGPVLRRVLALTKANEAIAEGQQRETARLEKEAAKAKLEQVRATKRERREAEMASQKLAKELKPQKLAMKKADKATRQRERRWAEQLANKKAYEEFLRSRRAEQQQAWNNAMAPGVQAWSNALPAEDNQEEWERKRSQDLEQWMDY